MKFTLSKSLEIIERTPGVIYAMLSGLSDEWVTSNEGDATWNAKEVVAHLIICEQTNWLARAKIILSDDANKNLEPIDMTTHFELAKNHSLETLLHMFKTLREESVAALKNFNLQLEDFTKHAFHPKIFEVNLQQLIATWVTHDLSHLTQISRIMAQQYKNEVGPFEAYLKILK
ncbi:DinB family protein [Niabella yanshanensis]|uniref:DinB family protein n=1 Tax=Niabella yanshanensis TaxID=577386 RepID=A0ABZ0WBE6_9BACT|nr:DinB family protein [Niabella yanshanensis]WQD39401.1 DinB family protein [Niabella yanshanensis]